MPKRYIHLFGNAACEDVLEAYGLVDKNPNISVLQSKQCPNCSEPNKPDSKFCLKCHMVLTYDAYSETLQQQEKQRLDMDKMEQVLERINMLEDKIFNQ
jgi:hypothetical protein